MPPTSKPIARRSSLVGEKGGRGRLIGRTKGGMNTKLHAICDSQGRPLNLFITAGQVSDYIGARALRGQPAGASIGCLEIAVMMPTGSEKLCKTKGYAHASLAGSQRKKAGPKYGKRTLQTAQSHRDHVRQAQGLAACGDPL